ncbi:ABC transporter ATP-binding protein [Streptomyces sp. NPDC095613]|uniref:ABC transporter ATP-binding protein n=1 Tax=Streptomyces sp. NPDC095613 TaxID=3155540 RepID=UPI003332D8C6
MTGAPLLTARALVKEFRRGRAVDRVDLRVREGERVALLGPNGAGKTTTLLMCLGVIEQDSGSVELFGHPLPARRAAAMARVGFAAGYLPLPDRLRVHEYLRMYADLYGLRYPGRAVREVLEQWRIEHLAQSIGTELSSGQRTLVGLAKAVLHRPGLLVLDEPTAALDPDVALRVRDGLLGLCEREGTALLVTSHDMAEVAKLCERVVFLSAGRVSADGSPAEVAKRFDRADLEGVFLHLAAERDRSGDRTRDDRDRDREGTLA